MALLEGDNAVKIDKTFDEALVDLKNPEECYSKCSLVKNGKYMALIILNFTLLIAVSAYNFW